MRIDLAPAYVSTSPIGALLGGAVGALWAEDGKFGRQLPAGKKADAVIFLFMCGGVSHLDTFDPKGNKYAGKLIDAIGFGDNVAEMKRPVIRVCARSRTTASRASRFPTGFRMSEA